MVVVSSLETQTSPVLSQKEDLQANNSSHFAFAWTFVSVQYLQNIIPLSSCYEDTFYILVFYYIIIYYEHTYCL